MTQTRMAPIRLIVFDAFDTLVTPRLPPYQQYAIEARRVGIDVADEDMRSAFKGSFKAMAQEHPVYGLHTGLSSSDEWWRKLIEGCMNRCKVDESRVTEVLLPLGDALLRRFETAEAYELAEAVHPTLEALASLHVKPDARVRQPLRMTLATNSDRRILSACQDLGLGSLLDLEVDVDRDPAAGSSQTHPLRVSGPTLSYDVGFEKPDKRFFHAAVQRAFPNHTSADDLIQACKQTLYVGDHYHEDFIGALQAGLQAAWLRRAQSSPTGDQLKCDHTPLVLGSMSQLVPLVEASWTSDQVS